MLIPFLVLAAEISGRDLPLDVIGGVRLGETEAVATDHLSAGGQVSRTAGERGLVTLTASDVTVMLCHGQVVHVERRLGDTVHEFARIADDFLRVHGPPDLPEIFAGDFRQPVSAGGASLRVTVIRLSWAKAPAYFVGYWEVNGDHRVIEALNADDPCWPASPQDAARRR